jgi:hypothetical protein
MGLSQSSKTCSNIVYPITREEINEIPEEERIRLVFPNDSKVYCFYIPYICQAVLSSLKEGRTVITIPNIPVTSGEEVEEVEIEASMNSVFKLITILKERKYQSDCLNEIKNMFQDHVEVHNDYLKNIQQNSDFYARVLFFIDDLLSFRIDRLQDCNYSRNSFLSETYFSPEEIELIEKFPSLSSKPLQTSINELYLAVEERFDNESICTNHDIAPIYERYFNLPSRSWRSDSSFKSDKYRWESTLNGSCIQDIKKQRLSDKAIRSLTKKLEKLTMKKRKSKKDDKNIMGLKLQIRNHLKKPKEC